MLYREIIAVCSQIHTKHIHTLCGQNVELLIVQSSDTQSNHWVLKGQSAHKEQDISGSRRDIRWRTALLWDITRVVVIAAPETSVKYYHCSLLNKTEGCTTLLLLTNSHARAKGVFVLQL